MHLNEMPKASGFLNIKLFDATGQLKDERNIPNLLVTTGLNWLAARAVGTPTAMSHMAIGSTAAAPLPANTTLGAELGRAVLTSQTSALNVATYSSTFAAGVGTGAVTEAGIFNAGAAGTMLNRAVFAVINKGALDTMQINWTVTQN
ncbi:hypothetical protein [Janthinobacterium sp. CG3]|uniref:hypothetical protein n=1 Tax=Janthinobacterium sp. CG3 TaxID=1075768 RepID=UPI00034AADCD|nr:hypothetical protein [Janthinobacterium sp. CG3]